MFIDYIALLLANLVASMAILACFLLFGSHSDDTRAWAAPFAAAGAVAFLAGLHMTLTWPITEPTVRFANIAFGQMCVLSGALFLATALVLAKKWSLYPLSVFGFVAGACAIVIALRLWDLDLTHNPALTCTAFILTGLGGIFAAPFLCLRKILAVRIAAAAVTFLTASLWAYIAFFAYWGHLARFAAKASG